MTRLIACVLAIFALCGPVSGAEVTLRLHHFVSVTSPTHADFLQPWADAVEAESGGRIEVQVYPSMQLGGKPPQLFDQARDGIVDISWTLLGYTPGRFPIAEVFELPFMNGTAAQTTMALQEFQARHLGDELAQVHPLLLHAPVGYKLHLRGRPVRALEDLAGRRIRAPSRAMTEGLTALGATAVGMPVPEVPQAMTSGVIDGALLPWEITASLRIDQLADTHTEFGGPNGGMSATVMALVMNKAAYDRLPPDLKAVIDANSGPALAEKVGALYDRLEAAERQKAIDAGASVELIAADQLDPWRAAAQPAIDKWVAEMTAKGFDGAGLLADARGMLARQGVR